MQFRGLFLFAIVVCVGAIDLKGRLKQSYDYAPVAPPPPPPPYSPYSPYAPAPYGAPGSQGPTGATGATGGFGAPGAPGGPGPQGIPGSQGAPGTPGTNGLNGAVGPTGPTGAGGFGGGAGDPTKCGTSSATSATSCLDIKINCGASAGKSGVYYITPTTTTYQVFCDMIQGWTLVASINGTNQNHVNGDAVGPFPILPFSYAGAKLSDNDINAIVTAQYLLQCGSGGPNNGPPVFHTQQGAGVSVIKSAFFEPIKFNSTSNVNCQVSQLWGTSPYAYTNVGWCGLDGSADAGLSSYPYGDQLQYAYDFTAAGGKQKGCYHGAINGWGALWAM